MTSPKIEAFLDIEAALARAVYDPWQAQVSKLMPEVSELVLSGRVDEAINLIGTVSLIDIVEQKKGMVRIVGMAALQYGAGLNSPLEETEFSRSGPPDVLDAAFIQYQTLIGVNLYNWTLRQLGESFGKVEMRKAQQFAAEHAQIERAVRQSGRRSVNVGANLVTSRLANYGALYEIDSLGIGSYKLEATLDSKTSKICRTLHGREFPVPDGFFKLEAALMDPSGHGGHDWVPRDDGTISFLSSAQEQQLIDAGFFVPPFHPSCRTICVAGSRPAGAPLRQRRPSEEDRDLATGDPNVPPLTPATAMPIFDEEWMMTYGLLIHELMEQLRRRQPWIRTISGRRFGGTPDPLMALLLRLQGFDGLPTALSRARYRRFKAPEEGDLWFGTRTQVNRFLRSPVSDLGSLLMAPLAVARRIAGNVVRWMTRNHGAGAGENRLRYKMKPGAKLITSEELATIRASMAEQRLAAKRRIKELMMQHKDDRPMRRRLAELYRFYDKALDRDDILAIVLGYDGITVPVSGGGTATRILNRTMIVTIRQGLLKEVNAAVRIVEQLNDHLHSRLVRILGSLRRFGKMGRSLERNRRRWRARRRF